MAAILLVVSSPERRGAEVFASQLAEWLGGAGHRPTVVALAPATGGDRLPIDVLGPGRTHPRTLAELVRRVRRNDVTISNGGTTLLPTMLAATAARRPFLYRNIGDPAAWGSVRGAGLRIGLPLRRASLVAGLYPAATAELQDRYALRPERLRTIGNAVADADFPFVSGVDREAAARLGLDESLVWVAYVGALSPEKRPDLAIEAVRSDPRLGLVMAGDGPEMQRCRDLAVTSDGRVILLGRVPSSGPVLRAVSAVVLPSRTEGVSGVAIEAGLSGVPVVTTAVGGMPDVVPHGRSGLVVPADVSPVDLAAALVDAAARRSDLGPRARRHCLDHYAMSAVGAAWDEAIASASGRRPA